MKYFSRHSMSLSLVAVALTMLFAFGSCTQDPAVKRFKEAAKNLDKTQHTLVNEFDYWPECGIRVTGSHLASLISLEELQSMLPCPLYVSGPHNAKGWDLENEYTFGYYNPEAIKYLGEVAEKVVSDKAFVKLTKPLVDEYLYRQMHIMMVMYDAMHDAEVMNVGTMNEMLDGIASREEYDDRYENTYDYIFYLTTIYALEDDSYVYTNTGYQFLTFLARRHADGTMDLFYDALKTVFMAYYPDYQYTRGRYEGMFIDYGEGGDYWYFDDSPISEDERLSEDETVSIFRDAVSELDNTTDILGWFNIWPAGDLRITGSHLASLISLRTLNCMLPCDLYVSGPHGVGQWELDSNDDFGHYNPEAIKYLNGMADRVLADKDFVKTTKPLVAEYLQRQMVILLTQYHAMNDKNICPDRKALLADVMNRKGYYYDNGENNAGWNLLHNLRYVDGDFAYSSQYEEWFLYFWGRRETDGTADLFFQGLNKVYSAYFSEFKYTPETWGGYAYE